MKKFLKLSFFILTPILATAVGIGVYFGVFYKKVYGNNINTFNSQLVHKNQDIVIFNYLPDLKRGNNLMNQNRNATKINNKEEFLNLFNLNKTDQKENEFIDLVNNFFDSKFFEQNNLILFSNYFPNSTFQEWKAVDSVTFKDNQMTINALDKVSIEEWNPKLTALEETKGFIYFNKTLYPGADLENIKINNITDFQKYKEYRKQIPIGTYFRKF